MKKLRVASKVNPPSNALRHSYALYWPARSSKECLGELSKRMGNSEAVCKGHYLETLTREEVRRGSKFGVLSVALNLF
jgi:hypothetical protein